MILHKLDGKDALIATRDRVRSNSRKCTDLTKISQEFWH